MTGYVDTINISINDATSTAKGAMSAADKKKLDSIDVSSLIQGSYFSDASAGNWDGNTAITRTNPSVTLTYPTGCCSLFMGATADDGELKDVYLLISFISAYCVAIPLLSSGLIKFVKDNSVANKITVQAVDTTTFPTGGYSYIIRKVCLTK